MIVYQPSNENFKKSFNLQGMLFFLASSQCSSQNAIPVAGSFGQESTYCSDPLNPDISLGTRYMHIG